MEETQKHKFSSGDHRVELCFLGHAETCVERFCAVAVKNLSALKPAETPCMDDHQFSPEYLNCTGELPSVCAQIAKNMPALELNWKI